MSKFYEYFRRFCALLVGLVLLVSGLLKLLDPTGAGLVVEEYFKFMKLGFLVPTADYLAVFLALAEAVTGLALISGLWRKIVAWITIGLMAFFTIISAVLVIFQPQMDCGCFGQAIHLSHNQTLIKNLILCGLCAVAFFPLGNIGKPKKRKYVSFALTTTSVVAFTIYSLIFNPLVDFTDYAPGARLDASIDASEDIYEATYLYSKDGKTKKFSIESLPDSSWTFVGAETERKRGVPSVSLSISDNSGEHFDFLACEGAVVLTSAYNPDGANWKKISSFAAKVEAVGMTSLVLVTGNLDKMRDSAGEVLSKAEVEELCRKMYFADYRTLIALNRSNGGATLSYDGMIVGKWSALRLPDPASLDVNEDNAAEMSARAQNSGHLTLQAFLLYVFAVALFI